MKFIQKIRKAAAAAVISLCMMFTCVPLMNAYAETEPAVQTSEKAGMDDETVFLFMMGGGLLIVIFAVVASVSSISAIAVAVADED